MKKTTKLRRYFKILYPKNEVALNYKELRSKERSIQGNASQTAFKFYYDKVYLEE
jgi:hypothetical protein